MVDDHALVHVEPTLPKALDDEMPMMRHQLEGITDRVVALETANLDKASKSDLLSVEQAVNAAAAVAVGEANEETQGRLMAEISALEERIDRRAHDEAMRAKEEKAAVEARGSIRRVSTTISAYTADLAQRLEVLQSEHAKQGAEVSRAAEEIAAAEADLKDLGSELVGLGQVANNVRFCFRVRSVEFGCKYGSTFCSIYRAVSINGPFLHVLHFSCIFCTEQRQNTRIFSTYFRV